jgi:hypothetical protein
MHTVTDSQACSTDELTALPACARSATERLGRIEDLLNDLRVGLHVSHSLHLGNGTSAQPAHQVHHDVGVRQVRHGHRVTIT